MGSLFFPLTHSLRLSAWWRGRRRLSVADGRPYLLLLPVLLALQPVEGQAADPQIVSVDTDSVSAQIESLDSFAAEQERLRQLLADKPKTYQDKVMEPGTTLLGEEAEEPAAESEGFRSWLLESRAGFADYSVDGQVRESASDSGIRAEYRQETRDYGEFVVQADVRTRNSGEPDAQVGSLLAAQEKNAARVTVRNYALPVTATTLANTSAGDIGSEVTDAFSRSYRVSLGSSQVRGVGTQVSDGDFDLRAGIGQRGELNGGPYAGFEPGQGSLSWLGYSQSVGDRLRAGVQWNQARDIPAFTGRNRPSAGANVEEDVDSLAVSLGYGQALANDGDANARLTVLGSRVSSADGVSDGQSTGVFVEGGFQSGRYRHELGAYTTGPDLRFGDNALAANSRSAYWRTDRSSSRLTAGGGVEASEYGTADASQTSSRLGLNANARYRLDRDSSVGGNASLTDTQTKANGSEAASARNHARSSNLSLYYQTRLGGLGSSRFSTILHRNEALVANAEAATGDELQWEQDWITGKYETMRPEFTTLLGLAHDRSGGEQRTYPTAGVNTRYWLDSDWNVAGNLRYSSKHGNLSTSQGLSGSASTEYELGSGWRTGATASINQARVRVDGYSLAEPMLNRSHDKSAQLYLRWEEASGTPYQLVGKKNAGLAGNGSITGAVFFDANRDGQQQADEAAVPGVEVFLDERYRTTTGKDGRFEFTQVTTGGHDLKLNPDSVPLPWGAARKEGVSIEVPLRGWAEAYIPVVRTGE